MDLFAVAVPFVVIPPAAIALAGIILITWVTHVVEITVPMALLHFTLLELVGIVVENSDPFLLRLFHLLSRRLRTGKQLQRGE